jgi:hypothetical protein
MTTNSTNRVLLGRATAAITFTRNNNRGSRHVIAGKQERKGHHLAQLRSLIPACLVFLVILGIVATSASAETPTPQWTVSSVSRPTNFAPAGNAGGDEYVVVVTNTGGAVAGCTEAHFKSEEEERGRLIDEHRAAEAKEPVCPQGSPAVNSVTITDELPEGLEALPGATAQDELGVNGSKVGGVTAGANFGNACEDPTAGEERKVSCTYGGLVVLGDTLILTFPVKVTAAEGSSVANVVRVSGGGAVSPGAMRTETAISQAPASFGISSGGASSALSSVQAGAHPDLTVSVAFNTENITGSGEAGKLGGTTVGNLKDTTFDLPPGFAGDLVDTPACAAPDFLREECPTPTQVGVTTIDVIPFGPQLQPVYNLAPEPGEVGKLGFWVKGLFYEGDVKVREPGEAGAGELQGGPGEPYGLKTTFYNATAGIVEIDNVSLTVWGVPAARVHDPLRWEPPEYGSGDTHPLIRGNQFGVSSEAIEVPYFTNPTTCTTAPLQAAFKATSWQEPEESQHPQATYMSFGPFVGCDALVMEPSLTAEVSSDKASAPTGLDVDTKIPQTYNNAQGVATPALNREVVTLPEGMTVNPSSGAGLQACSEAQYAEEGQAEYVEGHGCPNESKLATVKIKTPSIAEEVTGSVYLATPAPRGSAEPGNNPFNSLLALYLVARAPARGVLIKAPGLVQANPETGRLTTTFGATPEFAGIPASDGLPPLPASLITFAFNQGAHAPIVTPPLCGDYTVTAELTPWSNPSGSPLTPELVPFTITNGFNGGACPSGGTPPFNPEVVSYPVHGNAGGYSPLYLRISRNDGEQEITGFSTQFPAGLTGNLSGVAECSESQIEAARRASGVEEEASPSCPANSEIGYSVSEAGVGEVLAQADGKIYLGGPYNGSGACTAGTPGCAPFSVVAITSAHVGPFDLGTVVIHFPLDINPETAAVSIPAGAADQIPHIIKGIVIHVRNIRAYISREHFMLNPTTCATNTFSATVIGGGANPVNPAGYDPVTVGIPFNATANCQSLHFEPKFAASTSGKTSRADGASLHVDLTYPTGSLGRDANIKQVKVELPRHLPSRLTTLQKACTAAQFDANPAGCPSASLIGTAKAVTPILPVALEGPVYFVSHASEKFPSLEIVLQGDGVTIVLTGETFISHAGITSSTFRTVPDQPVTSFELSLPEGKFSALAANGSLCALTRTVTVKKTVTEKVHGRSRRVVKKSAKTVAASLAIPTAFIGQNGAETHQSTPVSVTGCPKVKKIKKAKSKKAKGKAKRK